MTCIKRHLSFMQLTASFLCIRNKLSWCCKSLFTLISSFISITLESLITLPENYKDSYSTSVTLCKNVLFPLIVVSHLGIHFTYVHFVLTKGIQFLARNKVDLSIVEYNFRVIYCVSKMQDIGTTVHGSKIGSGQHGQPLSMAGVIQIYLQFVWLLKGCASSTSLLFFFFQYHTASVNYWTLISLSFSSFCWSSGFCLGS